MFSCNKNVVIFSSAKIRYSGVPCCIHYKPNPLHFGLNKCDNFGEKDIISNKIKYDYATDCRRIEEKCGLSGKEWKEEPNIYLKIFLFHSSKTIIYFVPPFLYLFMSIFS